MGLVELSCAWRTLSVILTRLRSGTDSTADSRKITLLCCQEVSHLNQPESQGGGVDHCSA